MSMDTLTTCCILFAMDANSWDSTWRYSGMNSTLATRNIPAKYAPLLLSLRTNEKHTASVNHSLCAEMKSRCRFTVLVIIVNITRKMNAYIKRPTAETKWWPPPQTTLPQWWKLCRGCSGNVPTVAWCQLVFACISFASCRTCAERGPQWTTQRTHLWA